MLGIVVLNYQTYEITKECIDSILETYQGEYNLYIVDNASENDSVRILREIYKDYAQIKVLQNSYNAGFAKGNNFGIDAAIKDGCDYIILSNNDIIFEEDCIQLLKKEIEKNNNTVIVAPLIKNIEGKPLITHTERKDTVHEYVGLIRKPMAKEKLTVGKVYSISGCCFIINARLFKKMGAFDEGTFLYVEESIFSFQAEKEGYDILVLPQASVIHKHSQTAENGTMKMYREYVKSALYYWKKYEKASVLIRVYIWCMITLKCMIKAVVYKNMRHSWKQYLKETWKEIW